jgi:amino acid transporter
MESWIRQNLDKVLAAITAILAAGHLEHLFSAEWLVLLAAIVTFASEFIPRSSTPTPTPTPQKKP